MANKTLENGAYSPNFQGSRQRVSSNYMAVFRALIPHSENVVDIGTGNGCHVQAMRDEGWRATGIDGTPGIENSTNGLVHEFDLSKFDINKCALYQSTWAICFEVGEHIPPKYEIDFIKNLAHLTRQWLAITWAGKEDRGYGHVNCHHPGHVSQLLYRVGGFVFDEEKTYIAKEAIAKPKYKNKIMVFRR